MNRFRVRTGTHIESLGSKTRYVKGDVFESPLPLTKMFREKFDDLGPAPNGHKEAEEAVNASAPSQPAKGKKGKKADDWEAAKAN